ncbi:D-alanyl-D-alanine carboxypeptidase [Streptomyces sp. NPDC058294]|uniref:D-alanyl-D-alanine carboxypeptidase n=1 Tax=Streptomyces sp. NPDC058294 TaxID=3346430 RepID=UPI0036EA05BE
MEEASVAGESPDRSKQRESSAEPTSGSAGSVPEARDPRVAVSREKDSSGVSREKDSSGGGRVDTATRVLSVRGARPTAVTEPAAPEAESSTTPHEDTDLRTAVSAWVRGAETPKSSPGTSAKPATPAGPDPTSTESPSASAVGQDTASEATTGRQTGAAEGRTAPGTRTTAGAKADADAGAGAGSRPGSRPGAEADAEAKAGAKGRTGAKAPAKAPSKAASRAKATAKTGTAPEATGAVAAQTAPGAEATAPKTRTEGAAGTKARPGAKAQAGASKGASKGGAGDADAAGVRAGAAEDVAAADSTGTKPKAAVADSVATEDGPETGAAKDEPKAADAVADAEDTLEAAAAEDEPATTDAEVKPEAAGAEDELKAADADAGAKATDPKAAPKATDAEREPDATDADAEPEDADGGDDPQGPPAADESRTGGAGGKSKRAEGEAQAEAGAVDQATAVFKAVRPKKPAVDQPTTMLKLGGKPKPPESESERTSKFVALRDDMRPAAKAGAPATAPRTPAPASEATTTVPQVGPERTTQQPLPPKPPLDLLAELTNTPPPPETPVRTLVRRVKIWTPLVLLLVIVVAVVQAFRPLPPPTLALTAEDGYTFDGDALRLPWPGEGQGWVDVDGVGTMGHFGKQTPVAIGSVAKTMTAYIVLRDHPLKRGQEGPKIKVDAKAEKEGGYDKDGESTLNTVKAGDHLTEKQALSAVMIPSANNVARLLARWDAGSEAAFVKKMNATARQLGMTGTTYTDPSGLMETTVSTARDQVKLGRAVVKVPALVDITSAASWTDPSGRNWPNYNELPYRIGALGIKTGTTTAAGGNLLFASRKQVGGQTVTVVGAILDQQKPPILTTANEVSKTALLAAQKALTPSRILKKGDVVGYVDDRLGGRTPVVVTKDVSAVGWSGLKVSLSFTSGAVPHTAKAGAQVGSLTVGDGSAGGVKVPVALAKDLAEPGLGAKLTRIG